MREVFLRLKEANLRIKCEFFRQELLHVGHRVTSHEIGKDADKGARAQAVHRRGIIVPTLRTELRTYRQAAQRPTP